MNPVRATIETDCKTESIQLRGRLLQRLGQASLGHPDNTQYWFLHLRQPDDHGEYDVDPPYGSCEAAMKALDGLPARGLDPALYVVSGPFISLEDDVDLVRAPQHPSSAAAPSGRVDTPLSYVILVFKDDSRPPIELDATEYDALFWGRSSVHKFAVPYYVSAMGIKYGVRVHERFRGKKLDGTLTGEPPAYALVHEPDTEYSLLLDPNTGNTPVPLF